MTHSPPETLPHPPETASPPPILASQLWPYLTSCQREKLLRVVVTICREWTPPTRAGVAQEADCDQL